MLETSKLRYTLLMLIIFSLMGIASFVQTNPLYADILAADGDLDTTVKGTEISGDIVGITDIQTTSVSATEMTLGCEPAGSIDSTFSTGIVTTTIGPLLDEAFSTALQPDGKIVVAGYSRYSGINRQFAIARYNTDGTLDTAFGGDGIVTTLIGSVTDTAQAIVIQPDGKIVAAGYSWNGSKSLFAAVRYNSDGTLDTSFDGDGKTTTVLGTGNSFGYSAALQSDGKIVIAGSSDTGTTEDFALVRYNTDGSLDSTFDGDGLLTTAIGSANDGATGVEMQIDGKIVTVGYSHNGTDNDLALVRYNADGSLDTSFDGDGKVTTDFGEIDGGRSLIIQPDAKIVAAGSKFTNVGTISEFAVVRYNPNGSLDLSFDGDGKVITTISSFAIPFALAYDIALQSDQKLVVAGYANRAASSTSNNDFVIVRYNVNGTLDTSFDVDGKAITTTGTATDGFYSVAIQSDGQIVGAGSSSASGGGDFAVVRYLGSERCHATPTNTATSTPTFTPTDTATATATNTTTPTATETFTPTPVSTCEPLPSNVVSWWKGENDANDALGINNGTFINGTSFSLGKVGQAFDLPGSGNSQITVPHNPNLNITSSFSGETWIYPRSLPNLYARIFEKDAGSSGWLCSVGNETGYVRALVCDIRGLTPDTLYTSENAIALNQWNHVAFTYDGGSVRLFINGVESASTSVTGQPLTNTGSMLIGQAWFGGREFNGLIDEPSIYNRALSASEVQAIYNAGTVGKCPPVTPTATSTETLTPTSTATATDTPTATATETLTPTATATQTFSPTATFTPTNIPTSTPTATNTPTYTPTYTPTPAETPSIIGTVIYGNPASPTTKLISNAAVTGSGSPNVLTTTAPPGVTAGLYTLTGFGAGSYTVSVSKSTGQNGITSADAARIAQHVAGTSFITSDRQKIAADVTNNGAISSTDAAQLARFVSALGPPIGLTNQWRFFVPNVSQPTFPIGASPTIRSYEDPIGNPTGQDFIGILVGEVTGNWNPTAARPARTVNSEQWTVDSEGKIQSLITITVQSIVSAADKEIVVPVNVQGIADKGVISYEFDLRYDPSVMQLVGDVVDLNDTVSRGLSVVANPHEPGLLRVVVYGAYPIDGDGVLLNLRFAAVGGGGSMSPLTFERIMFNEGESRVVVTDSKIELF